MLFRAMLFTFEIIAGPVDVPGRLHCQATGPALRRRNQGEGVELDLVNLFVA